MELSRGAYKKDRCSDPFCKRSIFDAPCGMLVTATNAQVFPNRFSPKPLSQPLNNACFACLAVCPPALKFITPYMLSWSRHSNLPEAATSGGLRGSVCKQVSKPMAGRHNTQRHGFEWFSDVSKALGHSYSGVLGR